jgi:hypothetical protein
MREMLLLLYDDSMKRGPGSSLGRVLAHHTGSRSDAGEKKSVKLSTKQGVGLLCRIQVRYQIPADILDPN